MQWSIGETFYLIIRFGIAKDPGQVLTCNRSVRVGQVQGRERENELTDKERRAIVERDSGKIENGRTDNAETINGDTYI